LSPRASTSEDSQLLRNVSGATSAPDPENELPFVPQPLSHSWLSWRTETPVTIKGSERMLLRGTPEDHKSGNCSALTPWWCNRICFIISALFILDLVLLGVICSSKFFVTGVEPATVTLSRREDKWSGEGKRFNAKPAAARAAQAPRGIVKEPTLPEVEGSRTPSCSHNAAVILTARDSGERWMRKAPVPLELTSSAQASRVSLSAAWQGARVRRGPDWKKAYSNQDGGDGRAGTILHVGALGSQLCSVRWDSGQDGTYRTGQDGKYELEFLPSDQAILPVLDLAGGEDAGNLRTFGFGLDLVAQARELENVPEATGELVQRYFGKAGLRYSIGAVGPDQPSGNASALQKMLDAVRREAKEQGDNLHIVQYGDHPQPQEASFGIMQAPELPPSSANIQSPEEEWRAAEATVSMLLDGLGRVQGDVAKAWTDPERIGQNSRAGLGAPEPKSHLVNFEGSGPMTKLRPMPSFYLVGQLSRYVPAGSTRLEGSIGGPAIPSSSDASMSQDWCEGLHAVAFRRPDKRLVAVMLNCGENEAVLQLSKGDRSARTKVPAHAIQTLLLEVPCSGNASDATSVSTEAKV